MIEASGVPKSCEMADSSAERKPSVCETTRAFSSSCLRKECSTARAVSRQMDPITRRKLADRIIAREVSRITSTATVPSPVSRGWKVACISGHMAVPRPAGRLWLNTQRAASMSSCVRLACGG